MTSQTPAISCRCQEAACWRPSYCERHRTEATTLYGLVRRWEGRPLQFMAACARTHCQDRALVPLACHGLPTPTDGHLAVPICAALHPCLCPCSCGLNSFAKGKELTKTESSPEQPLVRGMLKLAAELRILAETDLARTL
jgi:hypothetical protein